MALNQKGRLGTGMMARRLVIGAIVCIFVTLIGGAICAALISVETIPSTGLNYCAKGILLLSSSAGAAAAAGKTQQKRLRVCMMTSIIYLFLLLSMTALVFGGQYQGVGVTTLVIFAGCTLAVLLGVRGENRSNLRRSKMRHR